MADRIRKINSQTGDVHSVLNVAELAPSASLTGLAVAANGTIYAADSTNHVVYKIFEDGRASGAIVGKIGVAGDTRSDGQTTIGLDGRNISRLNVPYGICVDAAENIYVSAYTGNKIYRLSSSGRSQTLAGTGVAGDVVGNNGLTCQFSGPMGIACDKNGDVYVCDSSNYKVKKVFANGKTIILAGSTTGYVNGTGNAAKFNYPAGVAVDAAGKVYIADRTNSRIRTVDTNGTVRTLAGSGNGTITTGIGSAAKFGYVYDICVDASGIVYTLDFGNKAILRIDSTGKVSTLMPWADGTASNASAIAVDKSGFLYILEKRA